MNRYLCVVGLFLAGTALLAGCGNVEETHREQPQPPVELPPPPPQPVVSFEANTDTVATISSERPDGSAGAVPVEIRFMIQVGAFKDPHNAGKMQIITRERYRMPVMNDYNAQLALYQIRIGFFESREAAHEFRRRLMNDYPTEYKDAWVVQLKQ